MAEMSLTRFVRERVRAPVSSRLRGIPAGLLLAAGLFAGPSAAVKAVESATLVVGKGDSISALFRRARIPQGQLMSLLHSSKQATKRLERVRPGAILSVASDADGKLLRVQITSKRGKQTTFVRAAGAHAKGWEMREAEVPQSVAKAPVAVPAAEPQAPSRTATGKLVREPDAQLVLEREQQVRKARLAALRSRLPAGSATITESMAAEIAVLESAVPEAIVQKASDPEPGPLAAAVRKAEAKAFAARMVAGVSEPTRPFPGLRGLPAKVLAAEKRVQRSRKTLLSFGPRRARMAGQRLRMSPLGMPKVRTVLASARNLLGTPYVWGGTTPRGFDCSGFVKYNLNKVGVEVPRTAHQQFKYTRNKAVAFNELQPGDLVFFHDRNNRRRIGHVGIFIGDGKFIHAVARNIPVKITSINKTYYRKRFVSGGRVIS